MQRRIKPDQECQINRKKDIKRQTKKKFKKPQEQKYPSYMSKESQVFKKCLRANIFEYEFFQPMQKEIPSHDPTVVEF